MTDGQECRSRRSLGRPLALLVLTVGAGPALATASWPLLSPFLTDPAALDGPASLPDLVAAGCAAVGLVAWTWLALGVGACWHSARRGSPTAPAWAPRLAHVLVAAALGVGLPALDAAAASTTDLLRGLQVPDRAVGTAASRPPAPARPHATIPVLAGDCLWDLAAAHLPGTATPGEVDRAWRALYRANRSRVGPDPDLLRPGTRLALTPALAHAPRPGGPR